MLSKKIITSLPKSIWTLRKLSAGVLVDDLTFQQFRILNQAYEGMGQTQMAQNLQVSMAAVSKMVDSLVKKDLLQREEGEDRRCFKLKLTKKGLKTRTTVTDAVEKKLNKNFKKLTTTERSDLMKGLDVLDKLMGYVNED